MILITSEKDFLEARGSEDIELQCQICQNIYTRKKKLLTYYSKIGRGSNYCSISCLRKGRKTGQYFYCSNCKKKIYRNNKQIKDVRNKSNRFFCCQSCSAIYNNTHKTKGTRRSKLEKYLETNLIKLYPNLIILFNKKEAINSELDIYIPSLNLAIELNGIFHYEPIYGQTKLDQIKNNDTRKFQACLEKGIELCIIDASRHSYFKEKTAKPYLEIVCNLINSKIGASSQI